MRLFRHGKRTLPVGDNSGASVGDPSAGGLALEQQATPAESDTATEVSVAPGWYADPDDPGAIRFWNGTDWTEQKAPMPPPASARVDLSTGASPEPPAEDDQAAMSHGGEAPAEPRDDEHAAEGDAVVADGLYQGGASTTQRTPDVAHQTNEADHWAEVTEKAVARARAVGTPTAWRDAAQAAIVVSEIAQTMQVAADVKQMAALRGQAASDAAQAAQVATQAAADAKRAAEQKALAAREAAQAARIANQAAADAKQTAEKRAQAAPEAAQASRLAAQVAADAKRKAQELEKTVTKARATNTPAAWSEALKVAEVVAAEPETVEAKEAAPGPIARRSTGPPVRVGAGLGGERPH